MAAAPKENYETFFNRIEPIWAPNDVLEMVLTYALAKHAHRWQTRKGEVDPSTGKPLRYFEHLRRVDIVLMDEVGCRDPIVIKGGMLHDGPEDTRLITPQLVEKLLGAEVASTVKLCSKLPKENFLERLMQFGTWRVLLIKGADRLDNLRTLGPDEAFQRKQIEETRSKYYPILDRMVELAPKEHKKGAKYLRSEIKKIVNRYERTFAKAAGQASPASRRRGTR